MSLRSVPHTLLKINNRLDKAIQAHKVSNPNDTFETTWYPFYLNPDAPKSIDKQEYYARKFGPQRTQ